MRSIVNCRQGAPSPAPLRVSIYLWNKETCKRGPAFDLVYRPALLINPGEQKAQPWSSFNKSTARRVGAHCRYPDPHKSPFPAPYDVGSVAFLRTLFTTSSNCALCSARLWGFGILGLQRSTYQVAFKAKGSWMRPPPMSWRDGNHALKYPINLAFGRRKQGSHRHLRVHGQPETCTLWTRLIQTKTLS